MQSRAVFIFYLEPVTDAEVASLVNSLKSSWEYDSQFDASFICSPLTYIYNLSLQEGSFPDEMKMAIVLPLFKGDDPEIFNNKQISQMRAPLVARREPAGDQSRRFLNTKHEIF